MILHAELGDSLLTTKIYDVLGFCSNAITQKKEMRILFNEDRDFKKFEYQLVRWSYT